MTLLIRLMLSFIYCLGLSTLAAVSLQDLGVIWTTVVTLITMIAGIALGVLQNEDN